MKYPSPRKTHAQVWREFILLIFALQLGMAFALTLLFHLFPKP